MSDLDLLKDIPGYKAILKSVLKSQIQMLMEQLSTQTGEESIVLTASIHDGSLSHLGSVTGKGFLEGRDELKAQFLGFCLNSGHKKETQDNESRQYGRGRTLMSPVKRQRPRIRPGPYSIPSPGSSSSLTSPPTSFPHNTVTGMNQNVDKINGNSKNFVKAEPADQNFAESSNTEENDLMDSNHSSNTDDQTEAPAIVKIERDDVTDNLEQEEENTENWDQNGVSEETGDVVTSQAASNLGGIAFPGLDNAHHDFSSRHLTEISTSDLKQALYSQGNSINTTSLTNEYFSPPQRKSQYWCQVCDKVLQNRNLYEYHINAHAGVRPYECEVCNRKFGSKQVLQTHKRLHSGERPFKCDIPGCDRSFTARSGLVYHRTKHHDNVTS